MTTLPIPHLSISPTGTLVYDGYTLTVRELVTALRRRGTAMMSAGTIRRLAREQAKRAARAKALPLVVEGEDMPDNVRMFEYIRSMPNIGTYRPNGWKLVEHCMVDKTGFGHEDEPALTISGLIRWVRSMGPGNGYAIIEEGQFQVEVGRFVSAIRRNGLRQAV